MLWQADRGEPLAALVRTFWSWRLAIAKVLREPGNWCDCRCAACS